MKNVQKIIGENIMTEPYQFLIAGGIMFLAVVISYPIYRLYHMIKDRKKKDKPNE